MTDHADTLNTTEEDSSIWKKPPIWHTAPIDAIILAALLLVANWYLARADPGWQRLNPTPWLLLPLFLGGRYGAGSGLIGAALATLGVVALQWAAENQPPLELLKAKPYFFLSLLLGGAIGTVIHHLAAGPAERLRQRALALAESNRRLSEDCALYRANEVQLVEALLLHGAESISLGNELRRIFASEGGKMESNLLGLLEREFGVISAAIYLDETGRHPSLSRVAASTVGESAFPDHIPSTDAPLAQAAISQGSMATWHALGSGPGTPDSPGQRHLAAIPWRWSPVPGNGPTALLLIGRMDFSRIDWENLSRIEAVFAWCMARLEPAKLTRPGEAPTAGRILPPDVFLTRIEEARDLENRLGLTSRLILFSADTSAPQSVLAEFVERLKLLANPSDAIGGVGDGSSAPYSIGLLISSPSNTAADRIARSLLSRIGPSSSAVHLEVLPLGNAHSPLPAGQFTKANPPTMAEVPAAASA